MRNIILLKLFFLVSLFSCNNNEINKTLNNQIIIIDSIKVENKIIDSFNYCISNNGRFIFIFKNDILYKLSIQDKRITDSIKFELKSKQENSKIKLITANYYQVLLYYSNTINKNENQIEIISFDSNFKILNSKYLYYPQNSSINETDFNSYEAVYFDSIKNTYIFNTRFNTLTEFVNDTINYNTKENLIDIISGKKYDFRGNSIKFENKEIFNFDSISSKKKYKGEICIYKNIIFFNIDSLSYSYKINENKLIVNDFNFAEINKRFLNGVFNVKNNFIYLFYYK